MPTNRRAQPEAEKRDELIHAARTLFLQDGYDTTPMNRIARQAGVTPNTIYWYFKDKDQLLLAVLNRLLQEDMERYMAEAAGSPLAEQMLWLVMRWRRISGLIATVHNRIRVSPPLDQWHTQLHQLLERLLLEQLPAPLPIASREAEIRIISFTIEGLLSHAVDMEATRQTCEVLAARCCALASGGQPPTA